MLNETFKAQLLCEVPQDCAHNTITTSSNLLTIHRLWLIHQYPHYVRIYLSEKGGFHGEKKTKFICISSKSLLFLFLLNWSILNFAGP